MIDNSFLVDALNQSTFLLKTALADFSEADMLARPAPAANHAAWQVGHLAVAEAGLLAAAGCANPPALPAGFSEKFTKQTAGSDNPAAFPKKDELLAVFDKVRAASVAWTQALKPEDAKKPMPESIRNFCPTAGHLALLLPNHTAMHLGQFQVARRNLGKPILF